MAFYAGLFVVVCWHTCNRFVRAIFAVIAVAALLIVGVSRCARGMHHLLDVVAGILLGLAALYVVRGALAKGAADEIDRQDPSAPERVSATGPHLPRSTHDFHLHRRDRSETVEHVARRHPGLVTLGRLGWVAMASSTACSECSP